MSNIIEVHGKDIFESSMPIAHIVNCQGVMGSGFAKQVRERRPDAFRNYKNTCNNYCKDTSHFLLGLVTSGDGVYNLHAQDRYGMGERHLHYGALSNCLATLAVRLKEEGVNRVALPFKMGAFRSGGDWDIICELIEYHLGSFLVYAYHPTEKVKDL